MKIFKPDILILLFIVIFLSASAKEDITIQNIHNFISTAPNAQESDGAIAKIKSFIKENPDNYVYYTMLALVYDYIKKYDEAVEQLQLAVKYLPKNDREGDIIYGYLAGEYIKLKKFDQAKPIIDKALVFNPDNLFNRMHLLSYYVAKDMYKEAAEELKSMSTLNKEKDYYYHFYAYAVNDLHKNGSEVIKLFRAGVKANPKNNMSHRVLAIALRDHSSNIKKDFSRIIAELNKALILRPKYIYTYISFADTYMFMGLETGNKKYFKKSLRWFNKANKLDPKNVNLVYAMGNFFVHTGEYDKAINKLEYAYVHGYNSEAVIDSLIYAYNNKADLCYKTGNDLALGLEMVNKALKFRPEDGMLFTTKAQILYKMENYAEAYEYIKKAITIYPHNEIVMQDFENIKKALDSQEK